MPDCIRRLVDCIDLARALTLARGVNGRLSNKPSFGVSRSDWSAGSARGGDSTY